MRILKSEKFDIIKINDQLMEANKMANLIDNDDTFVRIKMDNLRYLYHGIFLQILDDEKERKMKVLDKKLEELFKV